MAEEIVLHPDPRLLRECEPVTEIDDDVIATARRMAELMYKYDGCGIAAPQIGDNRQIVVIDCEWGGEADRDPIFLINPVIVEASDEKVTGSEGCLSVPGISVDVERSNHVVVQAYDLDGKLMQYEAGDCLFCVCLQHEIDHLHGITMLERLKGMDRMRAISDYQDALKHGARPGQTE